MSGYVLGRDAEQDVESVWDYVAAESVEAAHRLTSRLFKAFEALARNPGIGHRREDLTKLPVLFWPVGNYLVIYHVEKTSVRIVAVVHGKRDIPTFLRQRSTE